MFSKFKETFFRHEGKVDLVLDHDRLIPGERITGTFNLKGPKNKKKVSRLECDLVQIAPDTKEEKMVEVATTIYMSRILDHETWTTIPFAYTLPEELPDVMYRFRTRLVFGDNVQCTDHDEITIEKKNTNE